MMIQKAMKLAKCALRGSLIFLLLLCSVLLVRAGTPVTVILSAGQSNMDGRDSLSELPSYIMENRYQHCRMSQDAGLAPSDGTFERFFPKKRWGFDAVVYYLMDEHSADDFYVIKTALGGTSIDPSCKSSHQAYWYAQPAWLASNTSSATGGHSLLKAFTNHIGKCIDSTLSLLPDGFDIKVLLWHQGESDVLQAANYYDNLAQVVSYIRQYLAEKTGQRKYLTLPVVCGTVARQSSRYHPEIEAAIYRLQKDDPNFHVVDMSDGTLRPDRLHFDAHGAELLGKRTYQKLLQLHLIE